jgi:hypothetical protein
MLRGLLWVLLLAPAVGATEPDCCDDPKRDCCPAVVTREPIAYPTALIDRPMILPSRMTQVAAGVGLTNYSPPDTVYPNDGATALLLSLGADVGITRRIQLGAFLSLPMYPQPQFDTFVANLQVGLTGWLNLRVDVGAKRVDGFGDYSANSFAKSGFLAGLGLPIRRKLNRMFAFVSGSPSAYGFGNQPLVMRQQHPYYEYLGGGFINSSDLLAIWASDTYVIGALTLPIGFLFQPIPQLVFGWHLAYRFAFTQDALGETHQAHAVPLRLDVAVTLRHIDVGFIATILGTFQDPYAGEIGWGGAQQYDFYVQGRF